MAYEIQYSPQFKKQYPHKKDSHKTGNKMLTIIVIAILILTLLNPGYRSIARELLIPGKADVTVEAAETMAQNLRNGASLKDAVSSFCVEILDSANVY